MSILKSIIEEALLYSNDSSSSRNIDIRRGIISFQYYEDIFSPTITAKMKVINAGGAILPKDGKSSDKQSIYNGLPLRGGERLSLKIAGNNQTNPGLDFSLNKEDYLYVSSITDVISNTEKESFTLSFVSKEAIVNEVTRVKKRYGGNILDSVDLILKNVLKTNKYDKSKFDKVSNSYEFIGNTRKPFLVLTWLASKCVPTIANETAGFLFYQTRDGFQFKSIDNLAKKKAKATYIYSEATISYDENDKKINNDFKILNYIIDRNQNLNEKLRLGTYATTRYFYNPLYSSFTKEEYNIVKYKDNVKNLGSELSLPVIDGLDKPIGQSPSRIVSSVFDVGAVSGPKISRDINADQKKYISQSLMRYNTLFTQSLSVAVPSNTNLRAGDVIECLFPKISNSKVKEFDKETSGLYMIKELCHHFDLDGSYTYMKLVRDTFGINKEERDDND
jgi:hypothetical protein